MEWNVEFRQAPEHVIVNTRGMSTARDHLRMVEVIVTRDFWRPGMAVLSDNRELDFSESDFAVMRQAGENHRANDELIGAGKVAVLMRTVADYGRGRQYEPMIEGQVGARTAIFRDERQALRWLLD